MKRWIRFVALFYPRGWREEFGDEFDSVLDDVRPGWRVLANVLKGAMEMRISEGSQWLKVAGAMAAVGALVAFGLSFRVSPNYGSAAMVMFTPQPDPVRPTSAAVLQERAEAHVNGLKTEVLSRSELASIINDPSLELYREELQRAPISDVIEHMRRDLRIQVSSPSKDGQGLTLRISFFYPDQTKASAAVRILANRFIEQNRSMNRAEAERYQGFWDDMRKYDRGTPAPPPAPGEVTQVLRLANLPAQAPDRGVFVIWGLLLGVLAAATARWPRGVLQLAGFAAAGFILAGTLSYVVPNRFTSTAEMEILPALFTENPLVSPPPATPAAEFLRQVEPELLSSERLTTIILDSRLNLYSEERERKPIEEVVREMRANLHITPLDSSSSAFDIAFTYADRFKCQLAVEAVMNAIVEMNQNRQKAEASRSFKAQVIWERKDGELLDVLDTASLPTAPVWPSRLLIALSGLGAGLLFCMIKLWRRRPGAPLPMPLEEATAS